MNFQTGKIQNYLPIFVISMEVNFCKKFNYTANSFKNLKFCDYDDNFIVLPVFHNPLSFRTAVSIYFLRNHQNTVPIY